MEIGMMMVDIILNGIWLIALLVIIAIIICAAIADIENYIKREIKKLKKDLIKYLEGNYKENEKDDDE